jgi:hypothetical protein
MILTTFYKHIQPQICPEPADVRSHTGLGASGYRVALLTPQSGLVH